MLAAPTSESAHAPHSPTNSTVDCGSVRNAVRASAASHAAAALPKRGAPHCAKSNGERFARVFGGKQQRRHTSTRSAFSMRPGATANCAT